MAQSEHTDETGLPEWIADAILLNSLKELKTQSLSLFTTQWKFYLAHFRDRECMCSPCSPQLAYIPAEVIDGEEEFSSSLFCLATETKNTATIHQRGACPDFGSQWSFIRTSIRYIRVAESNVHCDDELLQRVKE